MATQNYNSRPAQKPSAKVSGAHAGHSHKGDKIVADNDGHTHVSGDEETYDKIVGSLGDVNDEGCEDLAGVRFIVNDMAYQNQSQSADYSEIAKAIVIGDVINNPRFKHNWRKK